VDRGEVAAAIEPSQHDGVEAVSFTPVTRFTRDKRRGDDLAVKAVAGKNSLKYKTGAGSLVTGLDRPLLGETPKQSSDLHQVTRECDDLRFLSIVFENGGSD
jgi:hypothetical protein